MASNELIAHTLVLKYQYAMPLYRQETYFDMMGATLSRQTLCNWTMSAAEALEPIYSHMKKELLTRNYINADDTTLKVINDNGKDSSSKKYLPGLKNVLRDGSLEVDNNGAERAIKPFFIGRKNFLFANTARGAISSANIYSIVETAKANKLVVERYLVYLFDNLSKIDISNSESLEDLMPWSNNIPENMKIKDM